LISETQHVADLSQWHFLIGNILFSESSSNI